MEMQQELPIEGNKKKVVKKKPQAKKSEGEGIKLRTQAGFYVHHFKTDVQTHLRNIGWGRDKIWDRVQHLHYAHSKNSQGVNKKFTEFINGHCHEFEWELEGGEFKMKVGKAFHKVEGKLVELPEERQHVHGAEYIGSDKFKSAGVLAEDE